MADQNAPAQSDDPQLDRTKAFFGDTVETLQTASAEGWDMAQTDAALTDVQRSHGYWSDTPVLGGHLGIDLGIASASAGVNDQGAVGVSGKVNLPATRDIGRDMDASQGGKPARIEVQVVRRGFAEAAVKTDNNVRAGLEFGFSAKVSTAKGVGGSVEGFVNHATDGTAQMGLSGSAMPGLMKGRFPVEVGMSVTSDMIDTETLVKDRMDLFEQTIDAANNQDFVGEAWARDSIYNVLDETGGGTVPESRLVFAAGVAEFEAKIGDKNRGEDLGISVSEGAASRLGLDRLGYNITQAGENEGFYRVEGKSTFSDTTSPHGLHQQEFDAIIDGSGRVIDGYELEHREGGAQNYHTVSDGAFGSKSPWSGQLDQSMNPREFGPAGFTNEGRQYARIEYERDKTAELDALEGTDLVSAYPESAARHEDARWSQDRSERAEENLHDAAQLDRYLSELKDARTDSLQQTPVPDDFRQHQTPLSESEPQMERNFTPLPDEVALPGTHKADPTSHAAPFAREILSEPDYAWANPDYIRELAQEGGDVPGVHMPEAGAGSGVVDGLRKIFTPDPPGLDLKELSQELHKAGQEVKALDTEQNGAAYTSSEGWRMAHPETHARWENLTQGLKDGSLNDMRVEVDLTNKDGESLPPHDRTEILSDAIDRASAAQASSTGSYPKALSGPLKDFNQDHPVPGSEEALTARGDAGALERGVERAASQEAQRDAAREELIQRPTPEYDYSQDQDFEHGIIP